MKINDAKCINETLDIDAEIIRYMDIPELLQLIVSRKLFFQNLINLRQNDAFEGYFSMHKFEVIAKAKFDMVIKSKPGMNEAAKKSIWETVKAENLINTMYFISWTLSVKENMAMWNIYSHNGKGVIVKSKIKKVIESVNRDALEYGKIDYLNLKETERYDSPMDACYLKSRIFEYENEIRFSTNDVVNYHKSKSNVLLIDVDPQLFIDQIIIGPKNEWMKSIVENILCCYNYKIPVRFSEYCI
jgi:Txe/YoeB family toxin of Txe-Axe toxin-antitoxin module